MLRELASCASPVIIDKTEHVRQEISREAPLNKCSRHSRIARAQSSLFASIMKRLQLQIAREVILDSTFAACLLWQDSMHSQVATKKSSGHHGLSGAHTTGNRPRDDEADPSKIYVYAERPFSKSSKAGRNASNTTLEVALHVSSTSHPMSQRQLNRQTPCDQTSSGAGRPVRPRRSGGTPWGRC